MLLVWCLSDTGPVIPCTLSVHVISGGPRLMGPGGGESMDALFDIPQAPLVHLHKWMNWNCLRRDC